MNRDVLLLATSKLSGDWSAPDFSKLLTKEVLQELLPRFEKLDPLVRMRLLLSAMHLPAEARTTMAGELKALAAAARIDKEEWVNIMGRAVGGFEGQLDMEAVVKGSSAVRETLKDLTRRAESAKTDGMRPLEEMYLTRRLQDAALGASAQGSMHSHFKLREGKIPLPAVLSQTAVPSEAAGNTAASAAARPAASIPSPRPTTDASASTSHRHASETASHAAGGKSGSLDGMFRSSRTNIGNRPAVAAASLGVGIERGDRSRSHRTGRAMLIDVGEAIALQQQGMPGHHSAHGSDPAGRGAPAANGQHQASPGQGEEPEEGELPEDGELPLLSEGDPAKRRRMDGTSSESYREWSQYHPPPPYSPASSYSPAPHRYSHSQGVPVNYPGSNHFSPHGSPYPGESRGKYQPYKGGSAYQQEWRDYDAPQEEHF